jgi:hypothetical protein
VRRRTNHSCRVASSLQGVRCGDAQPPHASGHPAARNHSETYAAFGLDDSLLKQNSYGLKDLAFPTQVRSFAANSTGDEVRVHPGCTSIGGGCPMLWTYPGADCCHDAPFGVIGSALDPREIQHLGKYIF